MAPAVKGVAMLVPPMYVYDELYAAQPVSVVDRDLVDKMKVPGAEMSGFILPSSTGPRLENAAIPLVLSASLSELIGEPYDGPHMLVNVVRSFSLAPTVNTFFAVAGFPNESKSISPFFGVVSSPLLPAEKRMVMFG